MVTIQVKGGAAKEGTSSLCVTCSWGVARKGYRMAEEEVFCRFVDPNGRVPFVVRECSAFQDRRVPTLYFMEKTAWVLLTKSAARSIGFVTSAKFREINGEDAEIVPAQASDKEEKE